MCKYNQICRSPCTKEGVVRLREVTPSLVIHAGRHTSQHPLDKTHERPAWLHTYLRQFISMQISICSSSGRAEQIAFSLLYHIEDLDCIVSSRAEPTSHENIQRRRLLQLIYSGFFTWQFFSGLLHLAFLRAGRCSHAHSD